MDKTDKTELNTSLSDDAELISEQQLSLTFDDIGKKPGIMSAEEYLKIQKAVKDGNKYPEQSAAKEKSEPQTAPEKAEKTVGQQDNSQGEKKSAPPADLGFDLAI